ncbi:MAG: FtsX-like permease family protein [Candidatus Hodarchaeota archaeon]
MNLLKIRLSFDKVFFLLKWIWSIKGTYSSQILVISAIIAISTSIFVTIDSQIPYLFETTQEDLSTLETHHIFLEIPYEMDFNSFPLELIHQMNTNLHLSLEQSDLGAFLEGTWMNPNVGIKIWQELNNFSKDYRGDVFFFEEEKKELISQYLEGNFPQNTNEIILVIPNNIKEHFLINSSCWLSSDIEHNSSTSMQVTGIIQVFNQNDFINCNDYNLYLSKIQNITGMSLERTDRINLLCPKEYFSQIIQRIGKTIGRSSSDLKFTSTIKFYFRIKANLLESSKVSHYLMITSKFEKLIKIDYNLAFISSRGLTTSLISFQGKIGNTVFTKFLFSIPILLVSLALIRYSTDVTETARKGFVYSLRIRGMSLIQLLFLILCEMLFVSVFSLILGVFSGIFISYSIGKVIETSSYFLFRLENWILILAFIAIISTFYSYKRVFSNTIRIYFRKEKIKRIYDDRSTAIPLSTKLFSLGITLFLVLVFVEANRGTILPLFSIQFYQILLYILALSSLFLTCIGLTSFMKIIFQSTIFFLSNHFWPNFHQKVLVIAIKNLARINQSASRIWYLLAILIIIAISSMTFNESINYYYDDQAKFEVGADYKIQFLPQYKNKIETFFENNISGHLSITTITIAEFNRKITSGVGGGSLDSIKVLGIDPDTYFNMNIDHPQYDIPLSNIELRNLIRNNDTNALASLRLIEEEHLEIGGVYSLNMVVTNYSQLGDYHSNYQIMNFTIISSYSLYPFVGTNLGECSMIVHQKYLEDLNNVSDDESDISLKYYYLIRNQTILSQDMIRILENNYLAHVVSLSDTVNTLKEKNSWNQIELTINNNIIYTLLFTSICLILYGKFQIIVKNREHAIERVLGLTLKEIFLITVYENVLVVLSSLFLGIMIGVFFSGIFFLNFAPFIFLNTTSIFPDLAIPLSNFTVYSVCLFMFMILSVIPSIFFQQRFEMGTLLKRVEYEE